MFIRIFSFVLALCVLSLGLAACGKVVMKSEMSAMANAASAPPPPRMIGEAAAASGPAQQKRVAVSHTFRLRLPSADIEATQKNHIAACLKLDCTILSTSLNKYGEDRIEASLEVRIPPAGYDAFIKEISTPPVIVTGHNETAEDKTVAFIDLEKRLEVKTVLRDRLRAMLQDPARKSAADLAVVEKELAQVQGDIESAIAQRDYLITITETLRVSVNYSGTTAQAGGFDLSPLRVALSDVGETIVGSAASLVSVIASLIPWIPVIALIIWGTRRGYRRWKQRRSA